jgi:NTE family protein
MADQDDSNRETGAPGKAAEESRKEEGCRTEADILLQNVRCPPRPPPKRKRDSYPSRINLVLEGGGLKGLALVGAVTALSEELITNEKLRHTQIAQLAGTSVGAIVAALVGAGYTPSELQEIITSPELARFGEPSWLNQAPVGGALLDLLWDGPQKLYRLFTKLGFLKGDYLLGFLRELLRAKGVRNFGDLLTGGWSYDEKLSAAVNTANKFRVHLVASDITRGRMIVLPDDLSSAHYGVMPEELDVALAVRMSVSFPFVFEPVRLTGDDGLVSYIVDGGLLSNFPLRLFDHPGHSTDALTIGMKLVQQRYVEIGRPLAVARTLWALASTALQAHDISEVEKAVDEDKWDRVIEIDTQVVPVFEIGPNPFYLSPMDTEQIYLAGYRATKERLAGDFLKVAMGAQGRVTASNASAALPSSPPWPEAAPRSR